MELELKSQETVNLITWTPGMKHILNTERVHGKHR
jgi:hypothetical protein